MTETLDQAGFSVQRTRLALSRNNAKFFGTLDLAVPVAEGVSLCVGVRNSTDKSFPIGFCAGHRVFVCDNMAFRSEIVVARKHTKHGEARFLEGICRAVQSLHRFKEAEALRIRQFRQPPLSDQWASHLLLRAYEERLVNHRLFSRVLKEWREPSFEEFRARTLWSFFNACTAALAERQRTNPQGFAALTIRLQGLLEKESGLLSAAASLSLVA